MHGYAMPYVLPLLLSLLLTLTSLSHPLAIPYYAWLCYAIAAWHCARWLLGNAHVVVENTELILTPPGISLRCI